MQRMRRAIIGLGLVLLVAGGIGIWRAMHPPLSPEQQIAVNLEAAADALQSRSTSGVMRYLAPEFKWNNSSRDELRQMVAVASFQWRDVQLERTNEKITVNGDEAVSSGTYHLAYRAGPQAALETQSGNYTLRWKLHDGEWKIAAATGGESMQN
jgi:ketosteroid isomerase-like protein